MPAWSQTTKYTDEINQLIQAGKYQEATQRIEEGLRSQPQDITLRFQKGLLAYSRGELDDAADVFLRLTLDYPRLPEPYNNLAVIYAAQGKMDKARSTLEKAMRTSLSYATAQTNLADIYTKLASLSYSKALQVQNPGPATARLALLHYVGDPQAQTKTPSFTDAGSTLLVSKGPTEKGLTDTRTSSAAVNTTGSATTASVAPTAPAPTQPASPTVTASTPNSTNKPEPTKPTTTAKPEPSKPEPSKPSTKPSADPAPVREAIQTWAQAWQNKNVKRYIASYANSFAPPGGLSRSSWEEQRRQRIEGKSKITVQLADVRVSMQGDNKATVRFRQTYRADGIAATGTKTLEMMREGNSWKIVRESI